MITQLYGVQALEDAEQGSLVTDESKAENPLVQMSGDPAGLPWAECEPSHPAVVSLNITCRVKIAGRT